VNPLVITGVGSRSTPSEVLAQMEAIGVWALENQVAVRSGHAEGADWAFEKGAQEYCIAYLPWPSFNDHLISQARRVVYRSTPESQALVTQTHPAPEKLSQGAWKLHGRNTWQVLGSQLSVPSRALVCWTPKGAEVGGTATAIALAQAHQIPVYNLALISYEEVLVRLVALQEGREVRACDLPPQPGDDKPVGDTEITWGELFGRK